MLKKFMLLSLALSVLISCFTIASSANVSADAFDKSSFVPKSLINKLEITSDDRKARKVWDDLFNIEGLKADTSGLSYIYIPIDNPTAIAMLPQGAKPVFFEKVGDNFQIQYLYEGARHSIGYVAENKIVKSLKSMSSDSSVDENDVFVNFDNSSVSSYNITKLREGVTYSRSQAEIEAIHSSLLSGEKVDGLIQVANSTIVEIATASSAKKVYWTPPEKFKASLYYNANWNFPVLNDGLGTRRLKVYLTRDYYVEASITLGATIQQNAYISSVQDAFNQATYATAKGLLAVAGVVVDTLDRLQEMVDPVPFQEYTYQWGNEGTVYDTTNTPNQDVEVWSDWGAGRMNLVNLIGGGGKAWGVSSPAFNEPTGPLTYQTYSNHAASKAQNIANIYSNNISLYGRWKHGPGNGLGY